MRLCRQRRAVSEVVGILLMLAIIISLGVLIFGFASGGLGSFSQGYASALLGEQRGAAEKVAVEQAAFASPGTPGIDGTSTNQVAGSSSSIAASLSTTQAGDLVVAYVSPSDTGSATPPSVSGISGGGLTWNQRVSTSAETYTSSYYVPVTITNGQASATPNPFQQSVTWDPSSYAAYEASDLGNIRFCADSACSTPLYAWLESCTPSCATGATSATAWVQLTSSIAGSGGTLTIYVLFEPTATDFDGVYWGEAPNLSATYGQYDNGADVFVDYFNGASSAGWTTSGAAGQTSSVPSGSPFGAKAFYANSANGDYMYTSTSLGTSVIIQYYAYTTGLGDFFFTSNSAGAGTIARLDSRGGGNYIGLAKSASWTSWNCPSSGVTASANTWYQWSLVVAGSSVADYFGTSFGYGNLGTAVNALSTTYTDGCGGGTETYANNGNYLGLIGDGLGSSYITYWNGVVVRAYPPNGVMPSVSLGSTGSNLQTLDLEEWYAVASSTLSAASITATLSTPDTAATWIGVFAISGADTGSPFDADPSLPATSAGASPSTTMSTSNANDVLLYACSAGAGGMAAGFTTLFSNSYSPDPNEYAGYEVVSSTQTGLATSCGASSYGAEATDAVVVSPGGADLYVRNVGSIPATLVSVYVTDLTSGQLVSQVALNTEVSVGDFVEIPHGAIDFAYSHGHVYSFTVTTSLGNSALYDKEAS
jgi:flagellin-like protein